MNTFIRRTAVFCFALIAFLAFLAAPAPGHSTKGRIKVPLDNKIIDVDDVAYFMESYVHHVLYKDRYEKSEQRFYVKTFESLEQKANEARICFTVLDLKENSDFQDEMRIHRSENGVWQYTPESGDPVEMYTYVMKWGYYYQRYILSVCAAGIGIAVALLAILKIRKW